jgi:stearoyl-CoA desaturase (delta-9 desaturase)
MTSVWTGPKRLLKGFVGWFDSWGDKTRQSREHPRASGIDWMRSIPFLAMHLACFGVIWVGVSPIAVVVAVALYVGRMFALAGFYHRYFSHRTYRTSRPVQFAFALAGATCVQRGPLWWAAHHRHHHKYSDREEDAHSPTRHGFFQSHIGWVMTRKNFPTDLRYVRDLAKFPELRFLDRFDTLVPIALAAACLGLGALLEAVAPSLGTSAMQMLVWGFFVSTVFLFHATCTINSLSHMIGTQPYRTQDTSRNNFALALLTLGEGWHNNHHHYMGSVRQGFRPWQIDITYYGLTVLRWLGLVWDLRPVPVHVLEHRRPR